ncbi:MAG: tyrosine-type recombinase/integrase [Nevskia sp.]
MPLKDTEVKNAKLEPGKSLAKLQDGKGMYLLVNGSGKYWRMNYRHGGKRKTLALGVYPDVTLKIAREKCDAARKQLSASIDPGEARKAAKVSQAGADSFEAIAREWLAQTSAKRTAKTNDTIRTRMEADLLPWLGQRPVAEIKAPELLATLRRVEARGSLIVAKRLRQVAGQIIRYAIATGRADRDPSGDLRGALKSPGAERHHAALTSPADVGALMRALDGYQGHFATRCALQLSPLVFVRPGELRAAEWAEIDLDGGEWRIPASRMKMGNAHIVPLSQQAVAILRELQPLTGRGRYVFPSVRTWARPMSNNTVNAGLRRIGYTGDQMTAHGFRAMARTLLAERGWKPDAIERQLAHKASGPLGAAYDRAQFLDERHKMMQAWADYLDGLKRGAEVIPLFKTA